MKRDAAAVIRLAIKVAQADKEKWSTFGRQSLKGRCYSGKDVSEETRKEMKKKY